MTTAASLVIRRCCRYEFQMQYGSIGWSVGALLGYAQAATDKRVIACIGDGSFQVELINEIYIYIYIYMLIC
jgi:TPP-dependent 2-oxoacid decarboxylase